MPNPNVGFLTSFVVLLALSLDAVALTCNAGYYGTSSCFKCPPYQTIPGTSASGTTVITGCYISKDAKMTDDTGFYTVFESDCYYKQDSSGGVTGCGSVRDTLFDLLGENLGQPIDSASIQDDTELKQLMVYLGMDSLDVIEFVMAVEQEFDIEISDADVAKWGTVRGMVDYVSNKAC